MYLQSLELAGFKSFAARTILEFHRGVTAVVGPNGCGKSNVLDAIRWVLGEQSAKALRGGEMADVIFGGTDSRQPLGMAEVSLTFSDCERELGVEWNEVRITRRVFRDGKSEYLINKTPCRLRDIHHLFMDTGIGRSAYSIMEQGKIDQILSSKPEDRRAIFEEAAGITKYKAQKKEALRKLEYTEANLLRVSDIIKEVKRQIGSLQRQAGKARRYQALLESLRIFDTHLSHRKFEALRKEGDEVRAELGGLEEAREVHESEVAAQEQEILAHRSRLQELDEEIGRVRDRVQEYRNRIYSGQSRIESHEQRQLEFEELMVRGRTDVEQANGRTREQEDRIQATNQQIEQLLTILRSGEEELLTKESRVQSLKAERQQLEESLAAKGAEASRFEGEIHRLRGEVTSASARREASEARLAVVHGERSQAEQTLQHLEQVLRELSQKFESLQTQLHSVSLEKEQAQARLSDAQESLRQLETKAAELDKRSAELRSRLEVLEQLEASGEGLGEATQALLRGLDQPDLYQTSLSGALANLVHVDPRYVHAMEALLGPALQTVIYRDGQIAESALQALSSGRFGRGGVASPEWFPTPQPRFESEIPAGALGWASDCVQVDPSLQALVSHYLERALVVESITGALQLRQSHPGYVYVTLQGDLLTPAGIAYAGSGNAGTSAALLRKTEIAELREALLNSDRGLENARRERDSARENAEVAQAMLAEHSSQLQQLQLEVASTGQERALQNKQSEETRRRLEAWDHEIQQLQARASESSQTVRELEEQSESLSARREALLAERSLIECNVQELRDHESIASQELNDLRVRVAREREQRESLERQREPMTARLQELAELIVQREKDISDYEDRIARLQAECAELRDGIATWQQEQETAEAEGAALLSQRSEIQENLDALDTALRSARKQLSEMQEQRGRLEVRTTQLELRIENICEHASRRYSVQLDEFEPDLYALRKAAKEHKLDESADENVQLSSPEASSTEWENPESENTALPPPDSELAWEKIESLVEELISRVDSMGPVNLDAIQEYEELEQRHAFLEQQNTDLVNSKSELLEVIAKINVTTRELFAETFVKIRVNFQEMFTELFGGGKANLVLTDESDPLESGIDIIAKPPGKQLQSISLLSGGERTMTAVSLLFAIYMVKPSPFCVLDEMDAPLDESNISRFIKILDRFVDQSQFVVITHNKRTIGRADMLYGVTMEEHGVSKLVGVKFRSRESSGGARESSVAESFGKSGNLHSEQQAEPDSLAMT